MCFEAHPLILIGNGSYIRFRRLPLDWKVRIEIFGSRVWHLYKKNRKSVSHWLLYQLIPPLAPHESFLSVFAWYDISPAARPFGTKHSRFSTERFQFGYFIFAQHSFFLISASNTWRMWSSSWLKVFCFFILIIWLDAGHKSSRPAWEYFIEHFTYWI